MGKPNRRGSLPESIITDEPTTIADIMRAKARRLLDRVIRDMDKTSNRPGFALLLSAIVVGSSVIMLSGNEPLLLGFPMLGVIGYIIALFLGLWLAISILRSGRL